ncbi:MAG TPA: PHB depolymerase family esterase [Kofleriaceae bacterium]|nr:PHB depolymerase family esterase [Kofleriaceae bacterium]
MRHVLLAIGVMAAVGVASLAAPRPARAASLVEVTGFGSNPSGLRMYLYVPDTVAAHPAVLVAVHYCTGSGPAFFSGTEFASLANQFGFIVIYPSATRSGSCFDVSSPQALRRNGGSDPVGIRSMVSYVIANRGADASRVYVTGASSGAMMTNVLLGDYPDVFVAGAAFMGVPFGCFATTDGSMWNSTCADGNSIKTAQQWGDIARAAFPGYSGPRPRMQLWHGTADATLRYPNFGEEIKQWTNVLGVSQTPAFTDHPQSTWTRTRYGGAGTAAPVEAISIQGVGHSLPTSGMAAMAIHFFGLDVGGGGGDDGGDDGGGDDGGGDAGGTPVVTITNDWGAGYCAALTVTNDTSSAITWQVTISIQGTIANMWNATYSQSGAQVTIAGVDWNGTLQPGQSTSSAGFCATR